MAQEAAAHMQIHASAWLCCSRCRWTSIRVRVDFDVVAAAMGHVQQCIITLKALQPRLYLNSGQQASYRIILVMQTWFWQRRVACVAGTVKLESLFYLGTHFAGTLVVLASFTISQCRLVRLWEKQPAL